MFKYSRSSNSITRHKPTVLLTFNSQSFRYNDYDENI